MTSVRHTTETMSRAIELKEAGWRPGEISKLLERELGVRPGRNTILRWTNPTYAERERTRMSRINARRWANRWRFNLLERSTDACRQAFIHRLTAEGVPTSSIAKVCTVLFGEPVSRDAVYRALGKKP